jgi:hypothetical protein
MTSLKLKVQPELYHHYLIGVAMKNLREKNPGQIFLKYGPIYFTNDDVKNLQNAILLSKDKLFPTSQADAVKVFDSEELLHSVAAMTLSAHANDCTIHHFSSKEKIDDEWFVTLVESANFSDYSKKLLRSSKI